MSHWYFEYSFDVELERGIIYEKIYGAWRVETAQNYVRDFEKETEKLIKKPWVKLCDLTNWKTASPEVIDIIGKHLTWCRNNNIVWSVNIINNPVTYAQLQKMFAKGGTKDISKTFRSREEGIKFLKQQGFLIDTSNGAQMFK